MTKNKLIEMLNNIKGNPEIVVWNGLVEDYMPVEGLQEGILVKEQEEFLYNTLVGERCRYLKTFDLSQEELDRCKVSAEDIYKRQRYERANPFVSEEDFSRWYGRPSKAKKVVYVVPKVLGKKYEDRIGSVRY